MNDKTLKPTDLKKIENQIQVMRDSGLSEDMIITLLNDKTRIGKRDIKTILDAIKDISKRIESERKMKF